MPLCKAPVRIGGPGLAAVAAASALLAIAGASAAAPPAQAPPTADLLAPRPVDPAFAAGESVYRQHCASCHDSGAARAPQRQFLQDMTPQTIHRSLVEGVMKTQGEALTADQRVAVSEYLAGRKLQTAAAAPANLCAKSAARFDVNEPSVFSGWGFDRHNTHFVPAEKAGIDRARLGKLALKWAFGFPDAQRARSQPALAGGAILVGSHDGSVYALDRASGCTRWRFQAEAEVRTAIVVSPWRKGDAAARPLAYFGDVAGNVYAVEAFTGRPVWKVSADDHPATVITGAPALYDGVLYVPVSSLEEASAAVPTYACCTFRGSVVALDAATGKTRWRTYMVPSPERRGMRQDGVEEYGPSGVAVWNAPAVDAKRGVLYVATGDNYSPPATDLSDAIVALDLKSGRIRWAYQATEGDFWNVSCITQERLACPEDAGPDFDFGAGTVLAEDAAGREMLLAGQKSGIVYALDPDSGKLIWQARVGRGGAGGGINFGMAAAAGRLFVPVTDMPDGKDSEFPLSPGLHAIDLASGKIAWRTPAPGDCRSGRTGCRPGVSGSVSVADGLVLAGADDGHLRIYDTANGAILWDFDTTREFTTVNGVPARGGAIGGGAAPVVWNGQLIVSSGYGFASQMPGNVLLVFEIDN
jgi:polyvinyl alcohol dehydrogenase (cytochrome)